MDKKWQTAVTNIKPNNIQLRGYPVDELMGTVSYAQVVYLAIKGELPDEKTGKMLDTMLVSSIDHGVTPPSALSTMTVASTGAPINASIAAGILAINKFHGGAIEDCMNTIKECKQLSDDENISLSDAVGKIVQKASETKKRLSGFGHRIHTDDPRSKKLFQMASELEIAGNYVEIAKSIESALEEAKGRKLPLNVDGAIAAILCELDFDPMLANAFFIMARIPGLVAHFYEERTTQKPMRRIEPSQWEYTGKEERHI